GNWHPSSRKWREERCGISSHAEDLVPAVDPIGLDRVHLRVIHSIERGDDLLAIGPEGGLLVRQLHFSVDWRIHPLFGLLLLHFGRQKEIDELVRELDIFGSG